MWCQFMCIVQHRQRHRTWSLLGVQVPSFCRNLVMLLLEKLHFEGCSENPHTHALL